MNRYLLIVLAVLLTACAVTSPLYFNSLATIRAQTDPKNSSLVSYDITGAVWVKDQPLMVNKEFNFGMAMSIEGAGVAIAVGERNNKNETLAAALKNMPPLNLNQRLDTLLKQSGIDLSNQPISVFGLLYGQPKAHLRTIVELYTETSENPRRFIDYSPWFDVEGENSWSDGYGEMLWRYFDKSLPRIVSLLNRQLLMDLFKEESSEEKRFSISGGDAVQRGNGYVVSQDAERVLIRSSDMPNTLSSIPRDLVEIQEIPLPMDEF